MTRTTTTRTAIGDPLVWALIFFDLLMFSALFASYALDRMRNEELFTGSQLALYPGIGVANTVLLLTASYCVAIGLDALRSGADVHARRLFTVALLLGSSFACLKVTEWSLMIQAGHRGENPFFSYYFGLTGLHLVNACAGLVILGILVRRPADRLRTSLPMTESGCAFWHVVDLVWLILFALLYLA